MIRSSIMRFRKVEIIRSLFLLIFFACLPLSSTFAQTTQAETPVTDKLELPPGIIHVSLLIKDIQRHQVTLEIIEVIAEGHGIVNVLSKGQLLTISIPEKVDMSKGQKMEAFLKERAGVDASQSSYTLLRTKNL